MRAAWLLSLLLWQAAPQDEPPVAQPNHMKYERAITLPRGAGQACAALDAAVFPHATPSLKDLRVFPSGPGVTREVPFVVTMSETVTEETQPARVLNLGSTGKAIVFDLEMPDRPYTDVMLDLRGQDFLATATVSGMDALSGAARSTALGVFTLFDLSSQHLSHDTTLPLVESTFRYLHVALAVVAAPGTDAKAERFPPAMVAGAQVPPSREAQTIYTTVAQSGTMTTSGRQSKATFEVPLRVPIERVEFELASGFKGNFSRDVRVSAVAEPVAAASPEGRRAAEAIADGGGRDVQPLREAVRGTILRVHTSEAGREIRTEQLGVAAILGANLQGPAKVEVTLENGDDQPLPIVAVRLQMRQRKLCFDTPAAMDAKAGLTLYYGDSSLTAPVYDYERLFAPAIKPLVADLGPEQRNGAYQPPPAEVRPFTERHPEVLWIALIAVVCALGVVALKSSRNVGHKG